MTSVGGLEETNPSLPPKGEEWGVPMLPQLEVLRLVVVSAGDGIPSHPLEVL